MPDNWKRRGSRVERLARAAQSTSPGTADGRVARATPTHPVDRQEPGGGKDKQALFSYSGVPVVNAESPPYFNVDALYDLGSVSIATTSSPTTSSVAAIIVNGVTVGSITLPSGTRPSAETILSGTLQYGDLISVKMTSVSDTLAGVTIQVSLLDG